MACFGPRAFVLGCCILAASCAYGSNRGYPATTPRATSSDSGKIDDPVKVLSSRAPGLLVSRTASGEIAITIIQGPKSFQSSSAPLYILDYSPFRAGPNGELVGVNPNDIASIQLLRKPDEIAMYGVRGANGVIIIRTRKPGT